MWGEKKARKEEDIDRHAGPDFLSPDFTSEGMGASDSLIHMLVIGRQSCSFFLFLFFM